VAKNDQEYVDIKFTPPMKVIRERFKRRLDELGDGTGDGFLAPNKKAAIFLDQWVQKNFRSAGSLVGGWPDFKRGGRWRKGRGNTGGSLDTSAKLLMDKGRLRLSFMPFSGKSDAGIGSDLKYAKAHHKGTSSLPERRLLPLHSEVRPQLYRIYSTHVLMLTRKPL